jgi:hypothetical protein
MVFGFHGGCRRAPRKHMLVLQHGSRYGFGFSEAYRTLWRHPPLFGNNTLRDDKLLMSPDVGAGAAAVRRRSCGAGGTRVHVRVLAREDHQVQDLGVRAPLQAQGRTPKERANKDKIRVKRDEHSFQ